MTGGLKSIGKSIGGALGFGGDDAVRDAGRAQQASMREQIKYLEGAEGRARADLAPFRQLGLDNIGGFQSLLSPGGQFDYLQSNPMFRAAIDNAGDVIGGAAAASGKFSSGGTVDQLFKNYLSTGESFINNQFNRLLSPVQIGANASAGTASNGLGVAGQVGGALGNIGDIQAASILGQQNANNRLGSNLLQIGGSIAGFSDPSVKRNVVKVGRDSNGNIYEFDYIWGGRYRGRMADELREIRPDAVVEVDGILLVSDEFAPVPVQTVEAA